MHGALATLAVVALGTFGTVAVGRWLAAVTDPTTVPQQDVPFLGGHPPATHAWNRFHARYYAMTLLFITFEMEMMFMYPWAVVFVDEGLKALADMGIFLGILSLGIVYAWREGALRWQ